MKQALTAAVLLLVIAAGTGRPGFAQDATLFQQPTVNATHIVFVYAGDLWIVPREGGDAQRLTAGVGEETDPYFSPDGSILAAVDFNGKFRAWVWKSGRGLTSLEERIGPVHCFAFMADGRSLAAAINASATRRRCSCVGSIAACRVPAASPLLADALSRSAKV